MAQALNIAPWRFAASAGGLAAAVFITAAISILLTRDHTEIAAIWPVNAIVLAAIIRQGRRLWAPLLGAAYLANAAANLVTGNGWIIATFCSAGNIVEIVLCAWALTRTHVPNFESGRARDFVRLLIGSVVGAAASAIIATIAITFRNDVAPLELFFSWLISDGLGLLIFTPIFSVLASGTVAGAFRGERTAQTASLVWLGLALGLAAIFGQSQINLLPAAPLLLILVAFVLEPSGVALATAVLSCTAIASATFGVGPTEIASGAITPKLHYLQGFLALLVLSGMPAAVALAHRRRLEQSLLAASEEATKASLALASSERRFASIAESARDIIVRYEPDTTMTYVSPASLSVLGYAPEELVGKRMQDFVHPDDLSGGAKQLGAVVASGPHGPPIRMRLRARHKDGGWRWMEGCPRVIIDEKTGAPLKFYDVMRDISDQQGLEEELMAAREGAEASEARYRLLADHSSDIIFRVDGSGIVRYASPSVSMLGLTPETIEGRPALDIVAPEDKAFAAQNIRENFNGADINRRRRREFRALHVDGTQIWLEANPSIVRDSEDRPIELVTLFRDVTARREAEIELTRARDAAQAATRAKSDFLANMSHELRTPLNSVIGFSRMLAGSEDLNERDQRFASLIEAASRTTLSIVNDVLDFAAIEKGGVNLRAAPFSVRSIVANVRDMIAPLADAKGLDFHVRIDSAVAELHFGDGDRMRQILVNLVSNAVKFTDQGSIDLTLIAGGDAAEEQVLRFEVKDSGIGVPAEQRDAIFERFVQAPDGQTQQSGGSGLGLAISKRLVECMGGALDLQSEVGKGSIFGVTLTLPVAAAAAASGGAAAAAAAPKRILVVDDVDLNRELTQSMLEAVGHLVETADTGPAALALCQSTRFDLIFMDVQMSGMDGLAATRAIRGGGGASANAPILALTAGALPEQVAACLSAGMNGHIAKPILDDDLLRAVAAWTQASEPHPVLHEAHACVVSDLQQRFAERLIEDRAAIEAAIVSNPQSPDIRSLVHRLAGSAGSFGFVEIGTRACAIDEVLAQGKPASPQDLADLLGAMSAASLASQDRSAA